MQVCIGATNAGALECIGALQGSAIVDDSSMLVDEESLLMSCNLAAQKIALEHCTIPEC